MTTLATSLTKERVPTGIADFDAMLRGGFMRGDAVMLAGSAGSGKTTIGLQYLVNGIAMGEPGIYLTFEQMPDQIYRDALSFGWDLRKLESEDKFRLICTTPRLLVEGSGAEELLGGPIKEIGAKRIVVDSVSHLSMFVPNGDLRKEAYRMVNYFKLAGLSSLLLWEAQQEYGNSFNVSDVAMSFLVDTIVLLKFIEIDSAIRRAMVVLKMRGSDHDKTLREYEITKDGVHVHSSFKNYQGIMSGSPTRVAADRFADAFREAAGRKGK
jgi:circadian clock protein KaiC